MASTGELDLRGIGFPASLLKCKRTLLEMSSDDVLEVFIEDPTAVEQLVKIITRSQGRTARVDKEEDRLGGAAAVAMLSTGFGARVTLAGVVGRDEPGKRLLQLLDTHGIEPHVWIDDRPTTWKQRIVSRGRLRPDRCDREVTTPIGEDVERFLSSVPLGDILLISDYGKGVCTRELLSELVGRAYSAGVPVLVDPAWSSYGDPQEGAGFGFAVASAGDVNQDGFDDVVVGAPGYDTANTDAGKAYLFLGSPNGLSTTPAWTSSGDNQADAVFGYKVASAGDVNNDGFDDVIVGALRHDHESLEDTGKAYVFHGETGGLSSTENWWSV